MERLTQLERQYSRIPQEIKGLRRWVCYNKADKIPMNALNGSFASSNNPLTWTTFNIALNGCVKYHFDGVGFMLGDGIFGIDLDDVKPDLATEFITAINSYTERSQSGKGIHIICKGKLPLGNRRKGDIEMYDSGRFFAMTGDVLNDMNIEDREREVVSLWEKYLNTDVSQKEATGGLKQTSFTNNGQGVSFGDVETSYNGNSGSSLSDEEVIEKARSSKNGTEFMRLYDGDLTLHGGDHSSADMAFCTMLAFWTANDKAQMDRIFRSSGLMRDKWNQNRGAQTYGEITLEKAIASSVNTYSPPKVYTPVIPSVTTNKLAASNNEAVSSNVDENGNLKIVIKQIFKHYSLDDTGNAERFYDFFGDLFRYNVTNKTFMYWNGKTWTKDDGDVLIKKHADALIEVMRNEAKQFDQKIEECEDEDEQKELIAYQKAMFKNATRVANKAGKEAMLNEFEHIKDVPAKNSDFDKELELLNTDSGVVNLRTGEIMPFNKNLMLSKNTNCKISFEEPTEWLKFLHSIFERENDDETKEIVDALQMALGYSLSGYTSEQVMFLLYGSGSNGKSTFVEQVSKVMGEYATTTPSSTLMQSKLDSSSVNFSIAKLNGARYVSTGETDEGGKLAESTIKILTGSDKIAAAFKFGNEFDFYPQFKIWMSTNNKPIIRGTDLGIWRRLFFFPFERTFVGAQKDKNMPEKLAKETPQILGWCVKGYMRYANSPLGIVKPKCIDDAIADYKSEMDVVTKFLNRQCSDFPNYKTKARSLYQNYKTWAKDDTEYVMSESKFGSEIVKKGYKKKRQSDGWYYYGIKLNEDKVGHIFEEDEN